jgi:hemoglobin
MRDIEAREDIEKLINHFYSKLLQLPNMQPVFAELNFEAHLPQIVHFWSFVLLDEEGYKTNVFDKHRHLQIDLTHFDDWLATFISSVDDLYLGQKADLAKQRATVLTHTFKSKWDQNKKA